MVKFNENYTEKIVNTNTFMTKVSAEYDTLILVSEYESNASYFFTDIHQLPE